MKMRIRLGEPMNDPVEYIPVTVRMWYDRHLRLWTLYPVDKDGNQTEAAQYAPNRAEAQKVKKDMEAALGLYSFSVGRVRRFPHRSPSLYAFI